jgi:hypothetical protein
MEISNATVQRLGQILKIPDLGGEDWDLTFADASRVYEFCDVYEKGALADGEKAALMELIVASYDQYLDGANPQADLEARLLKLLKGDFELHEHTIVYWSKLSSHDPSVLWAVSPLMREILLSRRVEA